MQSYLIIGGNSVAGQGSVQAIRNFESNAIVHATTSTAKQAGDSSGIAGADKTLYGIDLSKPETLDLIPAEKYKMIIFTPAFGPIGYPIASTPESDVKEALRFSYHPMVELSRRLNPDLTIGFTAFYWLPHTLSAYGSMAYAKIAQEILAVENSNRFRMIRAGSFVSKATRGIGLLLQRALRDTPHAAIRDLGEKWKASGKKFADFFFDYACECEKEAFGAGFDRPHRQTNQSDIERGVSMVLKGDKAPIINVLGDWTWTDDKLKPLPADFRLNVRELL